MTTNVRAELLSLRCYIEGEEVPCISASITTATQGSSSATIQLIGTDEAMQIRPRSIVEIYYKQNGPRRKLDGVTIPFYSYTGTSITRKLQRIDVQAGLSRLPFTFETIGVEQAEDELQYDLMFLGEVSGYTFYEDTQSRVLNLYCLDFSAHLDSINQYTLDVNMPGEFAHYNKLKNLSGANASGSAAPAEAIAGAGTEIYPDKKVVTVDNTVSAAGTSPDPKQNILGVIAGDVVSLEISMASILGEKGLPAGIRKILQLVMDNYTYYKLLDEELGLADQFFAAKDDQTTKLYQNATVLGVIFANQSRIGSTNSVRNLLKLILRIPHFEFMANPSAPFFSTANGEPALKQTLIKPELYFAEPPACNLVLPDEIHSLNATRQYLSEPTRGAVWTDNVMASELLGTSQGGITNLFAITPSVIVDSSGGISPIAVGAGTLKLVNGMSADLSSFSRHLMPEEVLKGIIPYQSLVSHFSRTAYIAGLQGGSDGAAVYADKGLTRVEILAKAQEAEEFNTRENRFFLLEANYRFLMAKYQTRTAEVSCKFLPRLVVGFTGLFCEKTPLGSLVKNNGYYGFYGYVTQVSHFITQAGGVSNAVLTYARPTNDYIDVFHQGLGGDTRTIHGPDFRRFVLPWTREYLPNKIDTKYTAWLGGLDWKGRDVDAGNIEDNLGILPLTQAISDFGSVVRTGNTQLLLKPEENYLDILGTLMTEYQQQVVNDNRGSGERNTVENTFARLVARPMANKLQVRGYLNAYFSLVKPPTNSVSGVDMWKKRQQALAVLGFDPGPVTGLPGAETRSAIVSFKQSLAEQGIDTDNSAEWNDAMNDLVKQSLLTSPAVAASVGVDLVKAISAQNVQNQESRQQRRGVRLDAVRKYKESLISPGGGIRG